MSAQDDSTIVSYRTLRRVVGVLGVALPVVVAVWGFFLLDQLSIKDSISSYYALRTRDAFVGILFTIAWFMFTYHGYEKADDWAGNLACVFALGVALFPNNGTKVERIVHFTSACALFLTLAFFSLRLFTKSSGTKTREKHVRNGIYRTCGWVMVAAVAAIGVYKLLPVLTSVSTDWFEKHVRPVFWLEASALWAFGVSWFIKGETLFTDGSLTKPTDARTGTHAA